MAKLGSTLRRLQKLRARMKDVIGKLEGLHNYTKGAYVPLLGIKPTTPCSIVESSSARVAVRRAVVAVLLPPKPVGAYLCHRCDVPKCVRGDHLFWGTPGDNMRDMHLKGRKSYHRARIRKLDGLIGRLVELQRRVSEIESRMSI